MKKNMALQTPVAPAGKVIGCLLCFYFFANSSQAQCLLNSAAPLFAENFNYPHQLPPGKTDYIYDTSHCPQPGHYTIVDSVTGCFGKVIHQQGPGRHLMFINSGPAPANVYTDTINNLCSATIGLTLFVDMLYASSSTSCSGDPVVPYFKFSVTTLSGQVLAQSFTGNLYDNGSVLYNLPFNNIPGNSSAVIKIDNLSSGGCGNAFLIDNIKIFACGADASIDFNNPKDQFIQICPSDLSPILLKGTIGAYYNVNAYQWQIYTGTSWVDVPGVTTLDYPVSRPHVAGAYQYRLTASDAVNIGNEGCRVASNSLKLIVSDRDPVTAGSNSPVCENSILNLSAGGGTSFLWSGPDGFSSTKPFPELTTNKNSSGQYKVIVSAGTGCTDTATTTVRLLPSPVISISDSQRICSGSSVGLFANGGNTYAWSPVTYLSDAYTSNPVASPPATIRYTINITDSNNCTSKADVLVTVTKKPTVDAGKDKVIIKGTPVMLQGAIADSTNITFSWFPSVGLSSPNILTPIAGPSSTTLYILTATSIAGCGIAQDSMLVTVYNALYLPNAFTPNGDGVNDVWHIPALQAFPKALLSVYNRWGNKIFESTGGQPGWDGTSKGLPQPTGAYVFIIDLKNNTAVVKGLVYIIR